MRKIVVLSFFLLLPLMYLGWPSHLYLFDGLIYAAIAGRQISNYQMLLFSPNHFIFNFLGLLAGYTLEFLQVPLDNSYQVLQIMNSFFGFLGALIFYYWIKKNISDQWLALAATAFISYSWLYWGHSIDAQVYIVSTFCLLLAFYFANEYSRQPSRITVTWLGISTALAVLAHQSNVLLLAAIPFLIRDKKHLIRYYVFAIVFAAAPYLAVMVGQHHIYTLPQAFKWLMGVGSSYSEGTYVNPYWDFHFYNVFITLKSIAGLFWCSPVNEYLPLALLVTFKVIAMVCGLAIFTLAIVQARIWLDPERQRFYWFSLAVIGIFSAFFSVWNPGNSNYLLGVSLLVFYLAVTVAASKVQVRHLTRFLVITMAGTTLVVNFFSGIRYQNDLRHNEAYHISIRYAQYVKPGDLVIASGMKGFQQGKVYLPYFFNIRFLGLDIFFISKGRQKGLEFIKRLILEARQAGHNVFVTSEIFEDREVQEYFIKFWQIDPPEVYNIFADYKKEKVAQIDSVYLYKLINKESNREPAYSHSR